MAWDVVVIGAGLSGLAAARRLRNAGRRVLVIEARDRVGGRTWTTVERGSAVDLGGQWVGPKHVRVAQLIREVGCATVPQPLRGRNVFDLDGRLTKSIGDVPMFRPLSVPAVLAAVARLEIDRRRLATIAPNDARLDRWDAMTVAEFEAERVTDREAKATLDLFIHTIFGAEPEDMSYLALLRYLADNAGLRFLADVKNGAQQDRIAGGAQQLSEWLARDTDIATGEPVTEIGQADSEVDVVTANGRHRSRRVIIAVAPPLWKRIRFEPGLPPELVTLSEGTMMGAVVKFHAFYARPFWRDRGLSGAFAGTSDGVRLTFDGTSPGDQGGKLVGFFLGKTARRLHDLGCDDRRAAALASLERIFGPEATSAEHYIDQDWSHEPWSAGCYTTLFPPGHVRLLDRARQRVGSVIFAGTELARSFPGYMEGAIESGERAADQLL